MKRDGFLKIMRILRDSEFSLSICPDHMPSHPDDPGKLQPTLSVMAISTP